MSIPNEENAGRLLGIVEQRRQHWSSTISALNGLALTLMLGIWTFFLKYFLDYSSFVNPQVPAEKANFQIFAFSYIIFAAGLSSIVSSSWRWYVGYLDNHIANLYPEIMLYEQILGVPDYAGMNEYLSDQKEIEEVMTKLSKEQQRQLVKQLVKNRQIGWRGHLPFDIAAIVVIIISIIVALADIYILNSDGYISKVMSFDIRNYPLLMLKYVGWILIVIGVVIQIRVFIQHQKKPSKKYIQKIVNTIKTNSSNQTQKTLV